MVLFVIVDLIVTSYLIVDLIEISYLGILDHKFFSLSHWFDLIWVNNSLFCKLKFDYF